MCNPHNTGVRERKRVCVGVCVQQAQFGQGACIYTAKRKDKKVLPYKVLCGGCAEIFFSIFQSGRDTVSHEDRRTCYITHCLFCMNYFGPLCVEVEVSR